VVGWQAIRAAYRWSGWSLRSVEPLSYLPLAEARSARPTGRFAPVGQSRDAADATIVLPRLQPIRSLPFLAQYLAQEIIGPEDAASRWDERDSAYRAAAASGFDDGSQRVSISA
jgi:hypothetical protein